MTRVYVCVCVYVCVSHYYSRVVGSVLLIQKCWAGAMGGSWRYVCMRVVVCVCVCGQHKTPLVFCEAPLLLFLKQQRSIVLYVSPVCL